MAASPALTRFTIVQARLMDAVIPREVRLACVRVLIGQRRPSIGISRGSAVLTSMAFAALLVLPASGPTMHAPPATPTQASTEFVRGAYGKDGSGLGFDVMAATGFNSVMTGPYKQLLDPLAAKGIKGVVWLGNWLNTPACRFERDDAKVTSLVAGIVGHPAILAYFLGDEPHVSECPNAPAQFKKRSDLVHSLDPGSTTFTVIQAYENGTTRNYRPWAGAVDIIGFDVYPCKRSSVTCDFGAIDAAINAIEGAGITRYWAIVQDFQDCYYRLPTPQELRRQFDHWAKSNMAGYFVFSWNYQPADPKCVGASLGSYPDNLAELKYQNSRTFAASSTTAAQQSSPRPGAVSTNAASDALPAALISALVLICIAAITLLFRKGLRP